MTPQEQLIIESDSISETYKTLGLKFNLSEHQIQYIFKKNKIKKKRISTNKLEDLTENQINFFKENINNYSYSYFEKEFNTTEKILLTLKKKLNLEKTYVQSFAKKSDWTETDLQLLYDNYLDLNLSELAKLIGKSERAISKKKWSLSLTDSNKSWSQEEIAMLKRYSYMDIDALSFMLERSVKAIKHALSSNNIKRSKSKETAIELKIKNILDFYKCSYIFNQKIKNNNFNFRPDFRIEDKKIIIEVHGDYWHANPLFYDFDDLSENQKIKIEKDKFKKEYYESLGYTVIILWEHDINTDIENVKTYLQTMLKI